MSRQRDLLHGFDRMRHEMDELFGDVWERAGAGPGRPSSGFSPRVDLYYCGEPPRAILKVELAGVSLDAVTIEVSGRELSISGERPSADAEGRVYQQMEIPSGRFRRLVELSAEVDAEAASASLTDGVLRVELPLRQPSSTTREVPIERRAE